ncbi:MAG: hypothetical protein ACREN1_06715 [Candidatus Dormibacteria bacterium]
MARDRIKSGLALVGACAALSILLPPLAGALNALGSLALLALAGYSAYRAWSWLERMVEASRRPATVRRNLDHSPGEEEHQPARAKSRGREADRSPQESGPQPARRPRWPRVVQLESRAPSPPRDR